MRSFIDFATFKGGDGVSDALAAVGWVGSAAVMASNFGLLGMFATLAIAVLVYAVGHC